jgi:predicted nucleic acid-binding Zn ribbon protein
VIARDEWACRACGKALPRDCGWLRVWCDRACQRAYRRAERDAVREVRACDHCGMAMPGKRPQARWCSDACKEAARRERDRDKRNAQARERNRARRQEEYDVGSEVWAACVRCGDLYLLRRDGLHCPREACQRAHKSQATRTHNGAQRVRRQACDAVVEAFTLHDVYERDRGLCYLCGGRVLPELDDGRKPESASLDHVIPVEQAGAHTLGNVRLAHFRCNAIKGRHSVEEARVRIAERGVLDVPEQKAASVPLSDVLRDAQVRLARVPRERPGGRPEADVAPAHGEVTG